LLDDVARFDSGDVQLYVGDQTMDRPAGGCRDSTPRVCAGTKSSDLRLNVNSIVVGTFSMQRRAIAVLAAFIAAVPMRAQAGQAGTHTFFGMAAYYPGRGGGLTAAHKTLPFGTRVRVTNQKTGRSVIVTINDRGPFNRGRVLDLCTRAARALGMIDRGVVYVRADVL
jgi:rare lipoprotein A